MSSDQDLLTYQCPNAREIVWLNGHGHSCYDISTNPHANGDWTDKQGRRADAYCNKIANKANNCPTSARRTTEQAAAPACPDKCSTYKNRGNSDVCTLYVSEQEWCGDDVFVVNGKDIGWGDYVKNNKGTSRLTDCTGCASAKSCTNVALPQRGQKEGPWSDTLASGAFNMVRCDDGFEPTPDGKLACTNGTLTPVECRAKQTSAPSAHWSSGDARYVLGAKGRNCTDTCANAGSACKNDRQARATYGRQIALDALERSGLQQFDDPALNDEEWRDNLRYRDEYTNNGNDYYAVPGLWIRGKNQAVPNWKNPMYTQMPSRCDARWGDMMRVCACEP